MSGAAVLLAQTAERKPAEFEVRLPADAELEVDGARMKTIGETRLFQSPPVAVGGIYAYTLKATWACKAVSREIRIEHGAWMTRHRLTRSQVYDLGSRLADEGKLATFLPGCWRRG
jgi:uncharacterized protein (TIGR03000 family)